MCIFYYFWKLQFYRVSGPNQEHIFEFYVQPLKSKQGAPLTVPFGWMEKGLPKWF